MCHSVDGIAPISNLPRNLGSCVKKTPIVGVVAFLEGIFSPSCQSLNLRPCIHWFLVESLTFCPFLFEHILKHIITFPSPLLDKETNAASCLFSDPESQPFTPLLTSWNGGSILIPGTLFHF